MPTLFRNTGRGTVVMSGILTPYGGVLLRGKKLDVGVDHAVVRAPMRRRGCRSWGR